MSRGFQCVTGTADTRLIPAASAAASGLLATARDAVLGWINNDRSPPRGSLQFQAHGLAWLAAYCEALDALGEHVARNADGLSPTDAQIAVIAAGSYLAQICHGIAMSQDEIIRPDALSVAGAAHALQANPSCAPLIATSSDPMAKTALIERMRAESQPTECLPDGLDDELHMIRAEFSRYSRDRIAPYASRWHEEDSLIPLETIAELGSLGVFGLSVPEEYGGAGSGKLAMCVVTEELSRGYLGVGSLGTRNEIASELILKSGTEAQKLRYLPKLASGEMIPTAVFTEPAAGSDLGSITTRAVRGGDHYVLNGSKTWITHAARADLMIVLARTGGRNERSNGLSLFLIEKPRGTEQDPFPSDGIDGTEIRVIGYRGMKEYEVAFSGLHVGVDALLGEAEGQGFVQLMKTFESARIQTAARAIGVAQSALDAAFRYANERKQFGRPIIEYQRISGKLANMIAELMIVRLLTYRAARKYEVGSRTDAEAGMAKLLAARLAWSAADNAVQIHGGNGYAVEYPISRILCDARILSIFEGAAEIQAEVVARRLLNDR
jgi:(2S)-methylsuccinyl-CoA dehydrogenase